MEMYEPVIGYDGMPVYSESYCQGDGYPITAGEPYKFKYGYVVDKANLDNMYIEFDGFTGVLYKYLVKVTDGKWFESSQFKSFVFGVIEWVS